MTVSRSTISGNVNGISSGGGLSNFANSQDQGQLTVIDCTIANNMTGGSGVGSATATPTALRANHWL